MTILGLDCWTIKNCFKKPKKSNLKRILKMIQKRGRLGEEEKKTIKHCHYNKQQDMTGIWHCMAGACLKFRIAHHILQSTKRLVLSIQLNN